MNTGEWEPRQQRGTGLPSLIKGGLAPAAIVKYLKILIIIYIIHVSLMKLFKINLYTILLCTTYMRYVLLAPF